MRTVTDHLGRTIDLPPRPQRIVSLCPSLTETLIALGVGDRLVGRTQFCIHPAQRVAHMPVVGGTKSIDVPAVADLQPDLIIAEKEENPRHPVETLAARFPVYVCSVTTLPGAIATMTDLGDVTGTAEEAAALAHAVHERFARLDPLNPPVPAVYLVWRDPFRAAGAETYIDAVMDACGLTNACHPLPGRYPTLDPHHLAGLDPRVILLPSEPFPFAQPHVTDLQAITPNALIECVDGEMFAWYGARMLKAASYLDDLIQSLRSVIDPS